MPGQARPHSPGDQHPLMEWVGVLAGPIASLLNLQVSYMLVPWACASGAHGALYLVPMGALLLTALGGSFAWRVWQRTGRDRPGDGAAARSRLLAVLGLLTSALFALVIIAQAIPTFILSPCQ
jgi:hypothetical protein